MDLGAEEGGLGACVQGFMAKSQSRPMNMVYTWPNPYHGSLWVVQALP